MGRISRKSILWVFSTLFVCLVLFQNCSGSVVPTGFEFTGDKKVDLSSRQGNGEIYDLKGQYHAFIAEAPCDPPTLSTKPQPNATIEYKEGVPYQTRKNCQLQPPVKLDPFAILRSPHHGATISYGRLHYESENAPLSEAIRFPRYAQTVCRGVLTDAVSKADENFDVIIRSNDKWVATGAQFSAQIIRAPQPLDQSPYQTIVVPEFSVSRTIAATGVKTFSSASFQLSIPSDNQGTVSADINGKNYSGRIPCDFEPFGNNLIASSNDFLSGGWANSPILMAGGAGVQLTPNAIQAPDGTMTGWRVADTSSFFERLAYHYYYVPPLDMETRTFSLFMKKGTSPVSEVVLQYHPKWANQLTRIYVNWNADGSCNVVPTADVLAAGIDGPPVNGWYRIYLTVANQGLGSYATILGVYPLAQSQPMASVGNVYLWGVQLEMGSFVTPYQPR